MGCSCGCPSSRSSAENVATSSHLPMSNISMGQILSVGGSVLHRVLPGRSLLRRAGPPQLGKGCPSSLGRVVS